MSRTAAARAIGTSEANLANWESGRNVPTLRFYAPIASAYGWTIDDVQAAVAFLQKQILNERACARD